MTTNLTRIDLLRHGEPLGGNRYRGSLDDPLSDNGWAQMRNAVGDHAPWQEIITSPLCRCADFAQELGVRLKIPVTVDDRLREMGFGFWEGRTAEEILTFDHDRLTRFWQNPLKNPPPNGEHLETLQERVIAAWEAVINQNRNRHLLLVAHGGVIRMIIANALGISLEHLSRITVPYACLTRLHVERLAGTDLPRLIFHAGSLQFSD